MARKNTAEALYTRLESKRAAYVRRAEKCAKLTIPMLFPETKDTSATSFYSPYQSVGARGVNNLSSKITMTQLPPNSPFFRLMIDPSVYEEEPESEEMKTDIEDGLAHQERVVNAEIETSGDRIPVGEGFKQLIVAGNVLLHDSDKGMKTYRLDNYVCQRDSRGNALHIVAHEEVAPIALPPEFYKVLKGKGEFDKDNVEETVSLYTHVQRKNDEWEVYQECKGRKIPGSFGTYPLDACPWLALRCVRVDGEDYGRSYVEEYYGDLASLEALTEAITEGSAMAAKVIVFVDPNGQTQVRTVATAANGDVKEGNAGDVTILRMDKQADFSVAERLLDKIERRLSMNFLLHSSVQRDAERVTREEIRYMAQELEQALGGIYSLMAAEFQLPYIRHKINKLTKEGKIPPLPADLVRPTIITGVDALGRQAEGEKLFSYLAKMRDLLGDMFYQEFDLNEASKRLASADGVDIKGLLKTPEMKAQEAAQAQQQQMMQQFGPEVIKQTGGVIQQQMAQGGHAPEEAPVE